MSRPPSSPQMVLSQHAAALHRQLRDHLPRDIAELIEYTEREFPTDTPRIAALPVICDLHAYGNRRAQQEDTTTTAKWQDYRLYALFDGHGGDTVSRAAARHLPRFVFASLALLRQRHQQRRGAAAAAPESDSESVVSAALVAAFEAFDVWLALQSDERLMMVGCTAIVALHVGTTVYLVNLGDSRGLIVGEASSELGHYRDILAFTVDQAFDQPEEASRSRAAGYTIRNTGPPFHVSQLLGMSLPSSISVPRSFGDFTYKAVRTRDGLIAYSPNQGGISVRPVITVVDLMTAGDGLVDFARFYVVLTCDGIWDDIRYNDQLASEAAKRQASNDRLLQAVNRFAQPLTARAQAEREQLVAEARFQPVRPFAVSDRWCASMMLEALAGGSTDNLSVLVAALRVPGSADEDRSAAEGEAKMDDDDENQATQPLGQDDTQETQVQQPTLSLQFANEGDSVNDSAAARGSASVLTRPRHVSATRGMHELAWD